MNPIRSEQDYDVALTEVETLMSARANTAEGDRFNIFTTLIQAYEARHQPIAAPDPIALIEFVMEQRGLDRSALQPILGGRGRVSEVLSRKRPLTLAMIRRLQAGLGLPADALVRPYPLQGRRRLEWLATNIAARRSTALSAKSKGVKPFVDRHG